MRGNVRFNLLLGVMGFVLTLLFSMANNLFMTSLIRALISFVIWFLLAFILRWVWGVMANPSLASEPQSETDGNGDGRGGMLDMTTPDESDEINEMLKPKNNSKQASKNAFTPLDPPKLVTSKDPEELAKAVRHLTEE